MDIHWKIRFLGGVHEKPIYRGELPKKGAWTVCRFKGRLGTKEGKGVDTSMHTMLISKN